MTEKHNIATIKEAAISHKILTTYVKLKHHIGEIFIKALRKGT